VAGVEQSLLVLWPFNGLDDDDHDNEDDDDNDNDDDGDGG
jgi:hypothetical protein